ncbi:Pepco domain-containing protein [Vreelandella venusta]|uniref:Pepco domain-containing protein n=1 Tax=Vreelandella venusta TaxID=44935 RepID=UPI004044A0FC
MLSAVLPSMSMASDQEQAREESTLPFLIISEDQSPVLNYERPYVIIAGEDSISQFPPQIGEGPWLPNARLTPSVEDIPVQAFADLKAKIEEAFDLMGDIPDSNYQLELIELHVTASAEGRLLIATAGMEGGMKLVFKRR